MLSSSTLDKPDTSPTPRDILILSILYYSCLRALLPTRDAARFAQGVAFCGPFLAGMQTTVTGAPPKATKNCGTKASNYSSACSCIPFLPTPTPPISA